MDPQPQQRVLTLDEIRQRTRILIPCLGGGIWCRRISSREYLAHLPAPLDDIEGEPPEARSARVEEWTKIHADAIAEGQALIVALASLEPRLTLDDARALGNEVADVAGAIFTFSFPPRPPEAPPAQ